MQWECFTCSSRFGKRTHFFICAIFLINWVIRSSPCIGHFTSHTHCLFLAKIKERHEEVFGYQYMSNFSVSCNENQRWKKAQSAPAGRPRRNKTLQISERWMVILFAMESKSWLKMDCMTTTGPSTQKWSLPVMSVITHSGVKLNWHTTLRQHMLKKSFYCDIKSGGIQSTF